MEYSITSISRNLGTDCDNYLHSTVITVTGGVVGILLPTPRPLPIWTLRPLYLIR